MEDQEVKKKVHTETQPTQLEQLKKVTQVVADTGDFKKMSQYKPDDATTNPTLILKAANIPEYAPLIDDAIEYAKNAFYKAKTQPPKRASKKSKKKEEETKTEVEPPKEFDFTKLEEGEQKEIINQTIDKILVNFAKKILEIVPGLVSIEVDARLSFDKSATVSKARDLIRLCEEAGLKKDRILVKIASTWEGIEAAKALRKDKINANLTLLFSLAQAVACGDAGVYLISPFVGRVLDWYAKNQPTNYDATNDPGVKLVQKIYNYYKKHEVKTVIMGASFRKIYQILSLAGCDKLTISPELLEDLSKSTESVPRILDPKNVQDMDIKEMIMDEKIFRWEMNQDQMASEKLADGIRLFTKDIEKLEVMIREKIVKNPKIEKIPEEKEKIQEEKPQQKQ